MEEQNNKIQELMGLIDKLSEYANDEKTTQETLNTLLSQIRGKTKESIEEEMSNAENWKPQPHVEIKSDDIVTKLTQSMEEKRLKTIEELKNKSMRTPSYEQFTFTRIREVKKPGKAHPTDAGIDFYVPDEKAWDEEFKNKVIEMSRNPIPPPFPNDGSVSEDCKDYLNLVEFIPGYETIGGEHRPMSIGVRPGGHVAIPSGIKTIIPQGLGMMFVNKSGIATKLKLDHSACLVDSEYRDEIVMCFFNHNTEPIQIEPGMKITQGLIVPIINLEMNEVLNCVYDDMGKDTNRGGGFGSSGVK